MADNNGQDSSAQQPKKLYESKLVINTIKNLYLSDKTSDVKFLFPSKAKASDTRTKNEIKTIPAHKFILTTMSEVFATMFSGMWKEKNEVEITDASAEAFSEFLQCFYFDSVTFTNENIERVMYLVEKYQTTDCMNACVQFLMDTLTPNDIGHGYELAILHNQHELRQYCEKEIIHHSQLVLESDDFLSFDRKLLAEILKLELLCKESTILNRCMEWAKMSCENNGVDGNNSENLRNQLGECLYLIRFNTMTREEFIELNTKYDGLLNPEDFKDIIYCLLKNDYHSEKFNQKIRIYWDECKIWKCVLTNGSWKPFRTTEIVQFTSNKRTLLGAVHCYQIYDCSIGFCDGNAKINIFEILCGTNDLIYKRNIFTGNINFLKSQGGLSSIKLPQPLLIENEITYEISFEFDRSNLKSSFNKTIHYKSPNGLEIKFKADHDGGIKLISALDFMDF